ncbi:hypothetical protein HA399_09240 [Cobetia sp. UIB-001]|uniref:hypothetical protein n=1 Tax=Cobetia sp. UIB-001 TaxID=2717697 RepID=UPI00384C31D1
MQPEQANIVFYSMTQAGLYKHGQDKPIFGNLTEILEDLFGWVSGKALAQTATYQVSSDSELNPSCLFDISKKPDSFLITIWNESPSTKGRVASVDPSSNVGSVKVSMNKLTSGTIPGYATYFWFIPSLDVFACIRFQHTNIARKTMCKYVESFIDPFSRYVAFAKVPKKGYNVVKYTDGSSSYDKLSSRFRATILRKQGNIDYILNNYSKIEKIIRKTSIKMNNKPDKKLFDTLVKGIQRVKGINYVQPVSYVNINYELPISMPKSDLEDIIDDWKSTGNSLSNEWDDYGFKIKGEMDKTYWLSNSLAKTTLDLNVIRQNDEIVDSASLIEALEANRDAILKVAQ